MGSFPHFTYRPVTYRLYVVRPRFVNLLPAVLAAGLVLALHSSAAAQLPPAAPLRLTVAPTPFSPNGDGRLDEVAITVSSDQSASVRIEVLDRGGTPVQSWTQAIAPGARASVKWDGKAGGRVVPDGEYMVRVRGETLLDRVEEARALLTVDTLHPEGRWEGDSPVLTTQDRVRFGFHVEDASSPVRVRLEIEDRVGLVGSTEADVGPGAAHIGWRARTPNGRSLVPGTYFASLMLQDAAGNLSRLPRAAWRVHTPRQARVVRTVPGAGSRVALTIDDCHSAGAWSRMLRTLRHRKAGATFFCPGKQIVTYPRLARRTIRDGHEIGAHAWDHALLTGLSEAQITSRLRGDADALWRVAQRTTAPYFRPPYGAFDRTVIDAAGSTAHSRVVMWDVDPKDWQRPGVSTIAQRVIDKSQPGSIVVLHTIEQSAAALPAIISGLRQRGLEPVGLSEMFEAAHSRGPGGGPHRPRPTDR